jgi:hypothetical protein
MRNRFIEVSRFNFTPVNIQGTILSDYFELRAAALHSARLCDGSKTAFAFCTTIAALGMQTSPDYWKKFLLERATAGR